MSAEIIHLKARAIQAEMKVIGAQRPLIERFLDAHPELRTHDLMRRKMTETDWSRDAASRASIGEENTPTETRRPTSAAACGERDEGGHQ